MLKQQHRVTTNQITNVEAVMEMWSAGTCNSISDPTYESDRQNSVWKTLCEFGLLTDTH